MVLRHLGTPIGTTFAPVDRVDVVEPAWGEPRCVSGRMLLPGSSEVCVRQLKALGREDADEAFPQPYSEPDSPTGEALVPVGIGSGELLLESEHDAKPNMHTAAAATMIRLMSKRYWQSPQCARSVSVLVRIFAQRAWPLV